MKKYLFFLCWFFCCHSLDAQVKTIKIKKGLFSPASFPGGKEGISKYLDRKAGDNIGRRLIPGDSVNFYAMLEINDSGRVAKVSLIRGSAQKLIDSIFVDALKKMPSWIPAKDPKGNNCNDRQFVSFKPIRTGGVFIVGPGGVRLPPRGQTRKCYATKEELARTTNVVGIIEDQLYVDSLKTAIVLLRIILADKKEYVDTKAFVVVQECNWKWDEIPGCYNCDMKVLTDKPQRFKDIYWEKYKGSDYKRFYLLDEYRSVKNSQAH